MALSSLSVVGSSLALHLYRPPEVMASVPPSSQQQNRRRAAGTSKGKTANDDDVELQVPLLDVK